MRKRTGLRFLSSCLGFLALFVSFLCFYSARWYISVYGKLGFDAILFTLSSLQGTSPELISQYISAALIPSAKISLLITVFFFWHPKRQLVITFLNKFRMVLYPISRRFRTIVVVCLSVLLLSVASWESGLFTYLQSTWRVSTVYEDFYASPNTTTIRFPEQKRNLIYIYLESMETTFLSQKHQGGLPYDTIPELYTLAKKNVNFSPHEDVGGFQALSGTTWTVASMVAQTCGIPLRTPPGMDGNGYGQDGVFLPGVTSLPDILHEQGYYQAVMFGSDGNFGGRKALYQSHGTDDVFDYYTAIADGLIPKDYHEWWGFEDDKLFTYAKEKLTAIASKDQPFAFTMLTADTHHIDGYLCPDCGSEFSEQYENVLRCSSRKVSEFVKWLQAQDFYENTTIIICGDHPTMDNGYISRNVDPSYPRAVYNCIINPAAEAANEKNRSFGTADLFPTTLAAMGCQIEGQRLGLGTNLFSETPTLIEELGVETLNAAYSSYSPYYQKNFLEPSAS